MVASVRFDGPMIGVGSFLREPSVIPFGQDEAVLTCTTDRRGLLRLVLEEL